MENFQLILKNLHATDPDMFGQTRMVLAFLSLAKVQNTDVDGLADMLNCQSETAKGYAESLGTAGLAKVDRQTGNIAISRRGKELAASLERAIT